MSSDARGLVIAGLVGLVGIGAALLLAPRGGSTASVDDAGGREAPHAKDPAARLDALLACAAKDPTSSTACDCADGAEELSVDLGRYDDARRVMDGSQCPSSPRHDGGRAEALVASGDTTGGLAVADAVLAKSPSEPHAAYARAWGMGATKDAIPYAERAVAGGRGLPALLLLGSLRMRAGDLEGARTAFDEATRDAPDDPRAAYDAAVVAQQQGRYHDAREGYLHALAIDPKMADARFNLVVLTHNLHADGEARHHLHELEGIAPGDPRIAPMKAELGVK